MTSDSFNSQALFVLRDTNNDHQIELGEIQPIWSGSDFQCLFTSMHVIDDGSVIGGCTQGMAMRIVDGNQDGTWLDDGETYINYDPFFRVVGADHHRFARQRSVRINALSGCAPRHGACSNLRHDTSVSTDDDREKRIGSDRLH